MCFLKLFAAYWDFEEAKAAMIAADDLDWPYDPLIVSVQAQGMRFCDQWRENADTIAQIVQTEAERFPEYHKLAVHDDPRSYSNYRLIMPRLVE